MKKLLLAVGMLAVIASGAWAQEVYTPNPAYTPGAVLTTDAKTVCKDHYTETVRNVPVGLAKAVFARYGISYKIHSQYEVDHLVSLELGGSNVLQNLWPQKYCPESTARKTCFGAREKDQVEDSLHRRVCKGEITLQEAQHIIKTDWYAEYKNIKGM